MHKNIDKIKKLEGPPQVIKNLFTKDELEKFFNQKVFLEINVKVVKDWRKKTHQLKNFGYN